MKAYVEFARVPMAGMILASRLGTPKEIEEEKRGWYLEKERIRIFLERDGRVFAEREISPSDPPLKEIVSEIVDCMAVNVKPLRMSHLVLSRGIRP